ncbi:PKS-NRPS hybrid synthetase psoA, partial [Frankliniella fusca]
CLCLSLPIRRQVVRERQKHYPHHTPIPNAGVSRPWRGSSAVWFIARWQRGQRQLEGHERSVGLLSVTLNRHSLELPVCHSMGKNAKGCKSAFWFQSCQSYRLKHLKRTCRSKCHGKRQRFLTITINQ